MDTSQSRTRDTLANSRSLGFCRRGDHPDGRAVLVELPAGNDLANAEHSVCGLKAFLVDERREFTLDDGQRLQVDCAKVAAIDISDSMVHVHGETVETYHILSGTGRMLLGEEVVTVGPGTVLVIPPGQRHGLCSDDPARPLRVLMTFTPGLAPISHWQVRDEAVLADSTAAVIAALVETTSS